MAGERQRLLGAKHSRPTAQRGLGLAIVEPGVATRDEQEGTGADPDGERLRDPPRLDPQRRRGRSDGGGAFLDLDDRQVGGVAGEPGTDGFETHRPLTRR